MRLIVLGATSSIAAATARLYASDGAAILLVGRNLTHLEETAADLRNRGAERVEIATCDLADPVDANAQLANFVEVLGGLDHLLLAYGILGDQGTAERNLLTAEEIFRVNFNSAAAWSLATANLLEKQGHGRLLVIGSVAGDRGRRANFVYGAAKAGLATLLEGISHRFADKGPRAVLIKPGPTITPMTEGMKRSGFTWSTPEQVAQVVYRGSSKRGVVHYAPGFWRYIMLIIRNLPTSIFNRMDI